MTSTQAIGKIVTGAGFIAVVWADLAALLWVFSNFGFGWGILCTIIPIAWAVIPFLAGTWVLAVIGLGALFLGAYIEDTA